MRTPTKGDRFMGIRAMAIRRTLDRFRAKLDAIAGMRRWVRSRLDSGRYRISQLGLYSRISKNWLGPAVVICTLLMSCSRSNSLFDEAPSYSAASQHDVSSVSACIADLWERSTRQLRRANSAAGIKFQGRTFFRGVPIGVKVFRENGRTRVQFFEERSTDRIYISAVKSCLARRSEAAISRSVVRATLH